MRYLNTILTFIAFLMIILIIQNCSNPVTPVKAATDEIQKVQIEKIGNYYVDDGYILVKVKE